MTIQVTIPIHYVTDCHDENTRGRLITRVLALLPFCPIQIRGLCHDLQSDRGAIEASGMIVDLLDASLGQPVVIMANAAHRNGHGKQWPNGTPFGYLKVGEAWIFGTIAGPVFSLLQKVLGERITVNVFDIPTAVRHLPGLDEKTRQQIIDTQFRSFEFLPRVVAAILQGTQVPSEPWSEVPEIESCVWWVDCFGNVKTTITAGDAGNPEPGTFIRIRMIDKTVRIQFARRLSDVEDGQTAIVEGSSGYGPHRWLEIQVQGGDASLQLGVKSGDRFQILK